QEKINQHEGSTVARLIRIGALLIKLKTQAGRAWTKKAKELGYHPRTASRLQEVGGSWFVEIGTEGSDFLQGLPIDLQKLSWLSPLHREQLEKVLETMDCKKVSRKRVSGVVKKVLGVQEEVPDKTGQEDALKTIERLIDRLTKALVRFPEVVEETTRQEVEDFLAGKLAEIKEALSHAAPPGVPAVTMNESV